MARMRRGLDDTVGTKIDACERTSKLLFGATA